MLNPRVKILFFAGLIVSLFLLSSAFPVREYIQNLLAILHEAGPIGLALLAILYVPACILLLPGSLLTLGAGFLAASAWPNNFPLALCLGTAAVSAGSVSGATAAFLCGRSLARKWIEERIAGNARFKALDEAVARNGFKMVFLVRLSPAFPFNLLNYALGLSKVRLRDYVLASWIGMLPGTIMYVYLGMGIQSATTLATGANEGGFAKLALQIAGLLATVAVVILVTRAAKKALKEVLDGDANHAT